ncbi:MAG TPA: CRTAC1 family protein [Thermoanaerobaculia bacterium]|nr:CRTAC1 family protein [Thermoanaerobaculia bacterium]
MRSRRFRVRLAFAMALPGAVALFLDCASRPRGSLPTLSDYSDGVSDWSERFMAAWRSGGDSAAFFTPSFRWEGALPGESLAAVSSRPPLSLGIFRAKEGDFPRGGSMGGPGARDAAALSGALSAIRRKFASLGRTEAVLFDFRRQGMEREVVLGILLTGRGAAGELRQEGGRIRARLVPGKGGDSGWRIDSARLVDWMSASASEPLFEERAEAAALGRVHRAFLPNAARNIPIPGEHMPPGAAVLDFDGDGRDDLFVPGGDGNRLYRNRGDGTFEDVTAQAGVAGQPGEAVGALAFDYDGDGRTDLYVTYLERPNLLFHNRGDGTFEELGRKAGVALSDYCTSAAAIDYDRDGNPDLYVLVYGPRDRGPNIQANNAPPNHMFHNNGDGTFTDVTKQTRTGDTGWGLALECADLDGDGWPDIYIANDFGNNSYLHNERDGTFRNRAGRAGILDPGFGMGVAIDDYAGDGRLSLYVSNYSFPMNWFLRDSRYPMPEFPYSLGRPLVWRRLTALSRGSSLFHPRGDGTFERASNEAGVWDTSWSWGCVAIDADMDGRADLFVVNGMVTGKNTSEREIDFWNTMSAEYKKFEKGIATADFGDDSLWGRPPKRFYRNLDGRRFAELAAVAGLESDANQRGLVLLDVNGDGAPDLFATGFLQRPSLWINRNPSHARSLVVRLTGDPKGPGPWRSTREALGAIVTVEAGGLRRSQVVAAGSSFLSSSARELFFGLGDAAKADRVSVLWPSGRRTEKKDVPAGRLALEETAR